MGRACCRKKDSQRGMAVSHEMQRSWRPCFCSMRQANSAFLTKLGWRAITGKDNLWSRVLRAKYCSGQCDINMFTPKTDASNAWKGVLECAKFLTEGAKTEIGNGKKTLFWFHTWVTKRPFFFDTLSSIPPEVENFSVVKLYVDH